MNLPILDDAAMRKLRSGYDRKFLLGFAQSEVAYAKDAPLVAWIANTIFDASAPDHSGPVSSLTPWERELAIICVASVQRDTFVLSGHIYWALMEWEPPVGDPAPATRSIEKIADLLLTTATYAGVSNLRLSSRVFEDVLGALKDLADAAVGPAAIVPTRDVLGRLKSLFPAR